MIKETVTNPQKISLRESSNLADYYIYYKHAKSSSKYLKVAVKYLNGEGYVITAYFVRYIK